MIHVDAMRFVDRYAGIPICWILTAVRAIASVVHRTPPLRPRKILIIKFSEMGSTVLAWPAFDELRRRIPDAELLFLTFRMNRTLFDALNPPGPVLDFDVSSPARMLVSALKTIRRLRRERVDTTIDMDFFSRLSAIVAYLVCRGNRVGFDRFTSEGLGRGRLLTHRVLYSPHVHTAAAFLSLARAVIAPDRDGVNCREAIETTSLLPPLHEPSPEALESVRRKLDEAGVPRDAPIVLINPNSSDLFPLRRWPLESYAELCSRLIDEGGGPQRPQCGAGLNPRGGSAQTGRIAAPVHVSLVITGTASEQKDAQAILDRVRSPRCVSFAGRTTFPELLALYAHAAAMVTNDSGPGHFAALLRLPTVVLFGPETPALYGPLNPNARSLYTNFACSPCVSVYNSKKSPCTRSRCLEAIPVDDVLAEVRSMLSRGANRPPAPHQPDVSADLGAMLSAELAPAHPVILNG